MLHLTVQTLYYILPCYPVVEQAQLFALHIRQKRLTPLGNERTEDSVGIDIESRQMFALAGYEIPGAFEHHAEFLRSSKLSGETRRAAKIL